MHGQWVICPIDPVTQRIILKIVGFVFQQLDYEYDPQTEVYNYDYEYDEASEHTVEKGYRKFQPQNFQPQTFQDQTSWSFINVSYNYYKPLWSTQEHQIWFIINIKGRFSPNKNVDKFCF